MGGKDIMEAFRLGCENYAEVLGTSAGLPPSHVLVPSCYLPTRQGGGVANLSPSDHTASLVSARPAPCLGPSRWLSAPRRALIRGPPMWSRRVIR